jgi:glycerol-3-phosphate dehydrogenase
VYDLAIIGGGVNGCGVARDATGRGFSVILFEMGDLASGTSSSSTKLIHGGLRYLEQYEFSLVRQAMAEREVLLAAAPHIISPLRFVLPHHSVLRPAWLLRLGLLLYDHIGGRSTLQRSRPQDLRQAAAGAVLKPEFTQGFEYSDCRVDDARLVILNARDAADRGAKVMTRTEVTAAKRSAAHWSILVRNVPDGSSVTITARVLVNAAGPWVANVLANTLDARQKVNIRLVKGSHMVVGRIGTQEHAFIFQNRDRRIVFAIPFEEDFTLIGTTDEDYDGDLSSVTAGAHEIDYLCAAVSEYLARPVTRADIVWSFSGVRPLMDDGAAKAQDAGRDYRIEMEGGGSEAKLINIFGGKITTYRRLAEAVLDRVESAIGPSKRGAWTREEPLPGGDFAPEEFSERLAALHRAFPFLDAFTGRRLMRSYGTLAFSVLGGAADQAALGQQFGAGLTEREVRYLAEHEWARSADDVLWRRTKLGLRLSAEERRCLEQWFAAKAGFPASARRSGAGVIAE